MPAPIMGTVADGVIAPDVPLPDGARVEIQIQPNSVEHPVCRNAVAQEQHLGVHHELLGGRG